MRNINQPNVDTTGVSEWWFTRNIIFSIIGIAVTIATFSLIPQRSAPNKGQLAQNEDTAHFTR